MPEVVVHERQAPLGVGRPHADQGADELVAAVPDHEVVGPQTCAQGDADATEQSVAGGVAAAVVHRLEVVDVQEGNGQGLSRPVRPGDLALELKQTGAADPGPGQNVQRRVLAVVR